MRGAFVACFGEVDQGELERVADASRWHRGDVEVFTSDGFHVAVQVESSDGPHVEVRGRRVRVVHGDDAGSIDDLQRRGGRFVALEADGATLRAARDPIGLAPLFYRVVGEQMWLATEVAPLVALGGTSPDLAALSAQAALVPNDADTGFEGIRRLLPGHSLLATRRLAVTEQPYWSPHAIFGRFRGDRPAAADELWARLLEGVDRTLEGHTGILVSGGLDSAAVTAAAALLGRPLTLVHVAFPDFPDAAEEAYARAVAESARAGFELVAGDTDQWDPEDDLETTVIPYLSPPSYTAHSGLQRFAELGLRVVLDGNDGDGVLGYRGREWGALVTTLQAKRLRELVRTYGSRTVARGIANDLLPPSVLRRLHRQSPATPTYLQQIKRYFEPALWRRIDSVDHERWRQPFGEWRWRQLRQVLPVTTARMEEHELRGARYGIDLRHPLADRDLVEFLVSLPVAIKSDPRRSKALLRDAIAGQAPDEVLRRQEKPQYLGVLEHRVDPARCLEWVKESGVRLPFVDYDALFLDGAEPGRVPLVLLLFLARAHVFAAAN